MASVSFCSPLCDGNNSSRGSPNMIQSAIDAVAAVGGRQRQETVVARQWETQPEYAPLQPLISRRRKRT